MYIDKNASPIQSGMADSQVDPNSIQENIYCSKLILLQSLYCLGWKYY